jgi:glycosyltransferase involved in cell wall biosynthesis
MPDRNLNVAMLLSCDTFESFFGDVLGLDRDRYLGTYRNDWSWYYAQGMLENGLRPTLYIPSVRYAGRYETDTGVGVRFLPCARWYTPLAKARRAFRATRWSLYAQEQINARAFFPALEQGLVRDHVDVLFSQEYWNGRFDFLADRCRVPLTGIDQGGLPDGVPKFAKRRAFANAAALFCQTEDECHQVERYGGRPLFQPNGCDTTYFRPPSEPVAKTRAILTVARLTDKQKRTSDLIRALALLDHAWSLDVVGTGPDRGTLEALARDLGVASRVRFHGFQSREFVRDLCRGCGVYAMPSVNEGVCLAMLEAMACGAAVVATRIRSFHTLIEDHLSGLLVPVADPPALAKAIDHAWAWRDDLGHAAAARIAGHFDTRRLYRQLARRLRAAAGVADDDDAERIPLPPPVAPPGPPGSPPWPTADPPCHPTPGTPAPSTSPCCSAATRSSRSSATSSAWTATATSAATATTGPGITPKG